MYSSRSRNRPSSLTRTAKSITMDSIAYQGYLELQLERLGDVTDSIHSIDAKMSDHQLQFGVLDERISQFKSMLRLLNDKISEQDLKNQNAIALVDNKIENVRFSTMSHKQPFEQAPVSNRLNETQSLRMDTLDSRIESLSQSIKLLKDEQNHYYEVKRDMDGLTAKVDDLSQTTRDTFQRMGEERVSYAQNINQRFENVNEQHTSLEKSTHERFMEITDHHNKQMEGFKDIVLNQCVSQENYGSLFELVSKMANAVPQMQEIIPKMSEFETQVNSQFSTMTEGFEKSCEFSNELASRFKALEQSLAEIKAESSVSDVGVLDKVNERLEEHSKVFEEMLSLPQMMKLLAEENNVLKQRNGQLEQGFIQLKDSLVGIIKNVVAEQAKFQDIIPTVKKVLTDSTAATTGNTEAINSVAERIENHETMINKLALLLKMKTMENQQLDQLIDAATANKME
ncbi:hypothetical protein PCE1_001647 [Barthelona sp. PCE]